MTASEKYEFEVYDPEQGKVFIWGDKFYAKIKIKLTYKQDGIEKIKVFDQDAAGSPFQMGIQTGPYIYDDTGDPIPWNNPGFYHITYDGQSIFNFYVWGPVLDYSNSDKYIGISRINAVDSADQPVIIRYSIKEMEGVTVTSAKIQVCDKNESVIWEIDNIPIGDNQQREWNGGKWSGEIALPGEYGIRIVSVGNGKEVPTEPHRVIVFKVDIETPCERLDPPYKCVDSFIARRDRIGDTLWAKPDGIPLELRSRVTWECGDDPTDSIASGTCKIKGPPAYFIFDPAPPPALQGRTGPLAYIVKATIRDDNNKSYESRYRIWQDKLDELRQEYEDMPERVTQPRTNFDQDQPATAYARLLDPPDIEYNRHNDNNGNWHILRLNNLNQRATDLDGRYAGNLRVTSGYRCPIANSQTSGNEPTSRHQYGRAFDFNQQSDEGNYGVWIEADKMGLDAILYGRIQNSTNERRVYDYELHQYVYPNMPPDIVQYTHGHAEW